MNAPTEDGQLDADLSSSGVFLPLMSAERFSELTGFPEGVLRGWMSRGYIPTYRIGKYSAINLAVLNEMVIKKAPWF